MIFQLRKRDIFQKYIMLRKIFEKVFQIPIYDCFKDKFNNNKFLEFK